MCAVRSCALKLSRCSWTLRLGRLRRRVYGRADARVGGASAYVAAHGTVDIRIGRRGIFLEQRRCGHDLPRLAISALWYLKIDPGGLYGLGLLALQSFNRRDLTAGHRREGHDAGTDRLTIEVDRAGTAHRHSAPELGAVQSGNLADRPQ